MLGYSSPPKKTQNLEDPIVRKEISTAKGMNFTFSHYDE
jgi:hypothetical protein